VISWFCLFNSSKVIIVDLHPIIVSSGIPLIPNISIRLKSLHGRVNARGIENGSEQYISRDGIREHFIG